MSKLDRSKPFAEVFGVGDVAHRYEQDGKKFDHSGHEIVSGRSPAQQKPAAQEAKKVEVPKAGADDQVGRQLSEG